MIQDFDNWAYKKGIDKEVVQYINTNIRSVEPARRVQAGVKNVSGTYPSQKMGVSIQYESYKVELPAIIEKEYDDKVYEYYDQPNEMMVPYTDKRGRLSKRKYTPDFFVISDEFIGWEEWKTEQELYKIVEKNPNLYKKDTDGKWHFIPGETFAQEKGLAFRVRTDQEINMTFQNNMLFLEDYFRYPNMIWEELELAIKTIVRAKPGISVLELLEFEDQKFSSDDIYQLIVSGELVFDLYNDDITTAHRAYLFADKISWLANKKMQKSHNVDERLEVEHLDLSEGKEIRWDNDYYKIKLINDGYVYLERIKDEEIIDWPIQKFYHLIEQGNIRGVKNSSDKNNSVIKDILNSTDERDLLEANKRNEVLNNYLEEGFTPDEIGVTKRTIYRWKEKYDQAVENYGNGFIGLIPSKSSRGNHTVKIPQNTLEFLQETIENEYKSIKQKSVKAVYDSFIKGCKEKGLEEVSYKTFCSYVNKQSQYETTLKRKGPKAAYKDESFYWNLDQKSTSNHGSRPFEIVHIDHTQLDVELVCSQTGANLGRPWITVAMDAFSRRVLAYYTSFDSPSYSSCMMTLRVMVKQYKRLPSTIVVDGGKEFHSISFETLLNVNGVVKRTRPAAKSRFGNIVERLFGVTNTDFLHYLKGNTQITKDVRQVTKSFNPKNNAVLTLSSLNEILDDYFYNVYDKKVHSLLGVSPDEQFNKYNKLTGFRPQVHITDFDQFEILSMPYTPRKKGKVHPNKGVKINGVYYWNEDFRIPTIQGLIVPLKYNPMNIGEAYAYVNKRWIKLLSGHYSTFKDRSKKEIDLITKELRKRQQNVERNKKLTTMELVDFIKRTEEIEQIDSVNLQRLRDRELRNSLEVIEGGKGTVQSNDEPISLGEVNNDFDIKEVEVYDDF
ncbi:TnsA endonuclease N-terminal domain-containing protein [Alkalibacillus sp. S2W]|uniref:TnsA endonuclease N-terminal domain-containing protein n=1 Tax=Alkalibacillus sp. S2W TaxID=3386553 RepID=UPI00398D23EF